MCAPRSVVAHGVLVSGRSLRVAYTPIPWRMISVAAGFMRTQSLFLSWPCVR